MGGKNSTARTARAVGDRPLLVRGLAAGLEPHRACRGGSARARPVGQCAAARPRQRGDRRRLHCRRRHTLPLQLLAAGDGNPRRRHRWERGDRCRPRLGDVPEYAPAPGLSVNAQRRRWRRRNRARPLLRQRPGGLHHDQRTAVRGDHAVVQQLLAGCPGERRLRASTPASTSAPPARTGSSWASRSAVAPSSSTCRCIGTEASPFNR